MSAKERTDDYMRTLDLEFRTVKAKFDYAEIADPQIIEETFKDFFERYAEDFKVLHSLEQVLYLRAQKNIYEFNDVAFIYIELQQQLINYFECMEFDDLEEE